MKDSIPETDRGREGCCVGDGVGGVELKPEVR